MASLQLKGKLILNNDTTAEDLKEIESALSEHGFRLIPYGEHTYDTSYLIAEKSKEEW